MRFDVYVCEQFTPRAKRRFMVAYITYREHDKGVLLDLLETCRRHGNEVQEYDMAGLANKEIAAYVKRNRLPMPAVHEVWYHGRPSCREQSSGLALHPQPSKPPLLRRYA